MLPRKGAACHCLRRCPGGLEALVIMGDPYIDYHPELIRSDVWLSPSAMRVVAESASLKTVRDLRVENERVGDGLVAVVAACMPGRLRRLELVDVGLTDDGAEALARLPSARGSDPPRPACQPTRAEWDRRDLPLALPDRGDDTGNRWAIL